MGVFPHFAFRWWQPYSFGSMCNFHILLPLFYNPHFPWIAAHFCMRLLAAGTASTGLYIETLSSFYFCFFIFYSLIIYLRITIPIIREQLLFLDFCRKIANILREPICFKEHFFCLYGNTLSEFCYLESLFVYYELCIEYQ